MSLRQYTKRTYWDFSNDELYYASLILLFGAEFTKVWAVEHGRRIEPEPGAVQVETQEREQTPQPSLHS